MMGREVLGSRQFCQVDCHRAAGWTPRRRRAGTPPSQPRDLCSETVRTSWPPRLWRVAGTATRDHGGSAHVVRLKRAWIGLWTDFRTKRRRVSRQPTRWTRAITDDPQSCLSRTCTLVPLTHAHTGGFAMLQTMNVPDAGSVCDHHISIDIHAASRWFSCADRRRQTSAQTSVRSRCSQTA